MRYSNGSSYLGSRCTVCISAWFDHIDSLHLDKKNTGDHLDVVLALAVPLANGRMQHLACYRLGYMPMGLAE